MDLKQKIAEAYGRNRGYTPGFASPTAPSLGGRREREDDEYHVPDPVAKDEPHAVHVNGKKWKSFGSKSHAQNVAKKIAGATVHKEEVEVQEVNDYFKRRQREKDVDAGKPVKPPPRNPQNDYFARRKKEKELGEAKEKTEYDYEGDMARGQLRSIIANAQQVHDMLKPDTNIAEWVQSKITLSADYISTVADYMQSEVNEQNISELSNNTLSSYKQKAGNQASAADKAGNYALGDKRFKGINRATNKQFDNDLKPPFDGPYKKSTGVVTDKSGAKHGGMSIASHLAKQAMKKQSVKEEVDLDEDIKKEYQSMKQHDIKTLRNMIKGQHKIIDTSEYRTKDHAISAYLRHKHGDKKVAAAMGLKEAATDTRIWEAWSLGKRDPQRGIKVGQQVRSYDFPGMHDDHYIDGHVVGETPHSYQIRTNRVVRGGKDVPIPAHMSHVEAPKGRGMFSGAYAVHKIIAKQNSVAAQVQPAQGAAKTFNAVRGKR